MMEGGGDANVLLSSFALHLHKLLLLTAPSLMIVPM